MAALTVNRPVPNTLQQRLDLAGGVVVDMVMTASTTIYEGSFVGYAAGTGTIAALATSAVFAGIALKKVVSDATAGSTKCPVFIGGYFQHAITALVVADVGKVVFASPGSLDNVLDVASTTLNAIGRVANFVSAGVGIIKMKTAGEGSGSSDAATYRLTAISI